MRLLGKVKRDELYRVLKNKFGFNGFRHRQKATIVAILLGHDAFVLMPTGKEYFFLNKIKFEKLFLEKMDISRSRHFEKFYIYLVPIEQNEEHLKEQFWLKKYYFWKDLIL